MKVSTVGLDLAKSVFQVHGVDEEGQVVARRQLRRSEVLKYFARVEPCLVGMEACASAHYWGRELEALGHEVRLMPPRRVKAYVKWGKKNDATDAEAICEAVTRPSMQFVPIKMEEQQSALMLHRVRHQLIGQRTELKNALRAHLGELGLVAARGDGGLSALMAVVEQEGRLPELARQALRPLAAQIHGLSEQIAALGRAIQKWHEGNVRSRLLATIPQFGAVVSSAVIVTAGDVSRFDSGRQFSAWIGLVPIQNSSGGKDRLGGITKSGDRYLRQLLMIAATGMIRRVRKDPSLSPWFADLLARKPAKVAAIALANKLARTVWAMLMSGEPFRHPCPAPLPASR